ncbi:MAG TPA: hypothetical protein VEB20_14930 [Azospirillaceae bacterium]|nr:hypothetical protein [Azospirillaceae bacterium]
MSMAEHRGQPLPLEPLALKVLGDGVLAATLVNAFHLPEQAGIAAILLAVLLGFGASMAAALMLVRAGMRQLWEVTSVACLGAMAFLLALHGALFVAAIVATVGWVRWRRLSAAG